MVLRTLDEPSRRAGCNENHSNVRKNASPGQPLLQTSQQNQNACRNSNQAGPSERAVPARDHREMGNTLKAYLLRYLVTRLGAAVQALRAWIWFNSKSTAKSTKSVTQK